jgi:hypothetical protein
MSGPHERISPAAGREVRSSDRRHGIGASAAQRASTKDPRPFIDFPCPHLTFAEAVCHQIRSRRTHCCPRFRCRRSQ